MNWHGDTSGLQLCIHTCQSVVFHFQQICVDTLLSIHIQMVGYRSLISTIFQWRSISCWVLSNISVQQAGPKGSQWKRLWEVYLWDYKSAWYDKSLYYEQKPTHVCTLWMITYYYRSLRYTFITPINKSIVLPIPPLVYGAAAPCSPVTTPICQWFTLTLVWVGWTQVNVQMAEQDE